MAGLGRSLRAGALALLADEPRIDAERAPDPTELLARHPQWRQELEEFFAGQDRVARWTEPLQALSSS